MHGQVPAEIPREENFETYAYSFEEIIICRSTEELSVPSAKNKSICNDQEFRTYQRQADV